MWLRWGKLARNPALPGWWSERSEPHGAETPLTLELCNAWGLSVSSIQGSASHRVLDSGDDK